MREAKETNSLVLIQTERASQALFMMNERGKSSQGRGEIGVTSRVLVSTQIALFLAS